MTLRFLGMSFTFRAADNPDQFDASPYTSGTFIRYLCYDDEGDDMGMGIIFVQEVLAKRGEEFAGVVVDGINCGVEVKDNRAWMKDQKGKIVYHLCECAAGDCKVKVKLKEPKMKGATVIHVDVRTALGQKDVAAIKWAAIPTALEEELKKSKRKATRLDGGERAPERDVAGRAEELRAHRGDLEEELEKLSNRISGSNNKDPAVQERLNALRDKLGKHRKDAVRGAKGEEAPVAKRVRLGEIIKSRSDAVNQPRRSSASREEEVDLVDVKGETDQTDVKAFRKQIIKALGGKPGGDGVDESSSGEEEGGLMDRSRHVNLIRTWKSRPGQLTLKTLSRMQDTLGVHQLPHHNTSDVGAPIATAYVHQVMRTQFPGEKMTLRNWRELLTLSQVMDLCLAGKVESGMDMMAQRIKAIERSLVDGSWNQARWMELIPTGDALLASRSEAKAAHRAEAEERRRAPQK